MIEKLEFELLERMSKEIQRNGIQGGKHVLTRFKYGFITFSETYNVFNKLLTEETGK